MPTPNRFDVEHEVRQAVRQVLAGNRQESDRIELKRGWPGFDKARQLAGSANKAAGDYVLWVIGVDETERTLHDTGDTDIATWWPRMQKGFNQQPPTLALDLNVFIDVERSVKVLVFSTDDYPYVVNKDNDNRDVPMREGTRTRSAHRHELIDLLYPHIGVPRAEVMGLGLFAEWHAETTRDGTHTSDGQPRTVEERLSLSGRATIFLEHLSKDIVTLPAHLMTGRLFTGQVVTDVKLNTHASKDRPPPPHGAWIHQGVRASGPGTFVALSAPHFA